jgi:chromosomal replication initiator protein
MTFTPEVWDGVLRRLQSEVPSFSFEAWLAPLEARSHGRDLVLVCPSTFHRERIRDHYLPHIDACLRQVMGDDSHAMLTIELGVKARRAANGATGNGSTGFATAQTAAAVRAERDVARPRGARRAEGDAPAKTVHRHATRTPVVVTASSADPDATGSVARLRPPEEEAAPHTFDTFVVGPCNALAREAALAVARDQQRGLSQLYLCAESGMGKTHLSRAIAAEAKLVGANAVQYVSAETFTNQFMAALRSNRTGDFKRRYRGRRQLLVVEDVQFLEKKDATQLEFFHTVAHVLDTGGRVVLTGDRMPNQMPDLRDRLRSQLMGGFVAELEPPDAQLRRAILRSKAAHGGWRLPADCLDLLVESVGGSVRDLEGFLIQLVTTSALLGKPIDLALTRDSIAKKCPTRNDGRPRLSVRDVIRAVAAFFQTSPERLAAKTRKQEILLPRQLAMYLCRRYTEASVAEIGQALGRDHPAVRNAIDKMERAILEKPKVRYQVEALVERLEGR